MTDRVDEAFVRAFGAPPDAEAEAPARVNLIGEHTDYHHGYVLPTVLPQRTHVWLRRGVPGRVRAYSATLGGDAGTYLLGDEQPGHGWIDYVQGVTHVLRGHGVEAGGFDVWIASTIPVGGGVSSSAALCVSLLRGLRSLFQLDLDDHALARLAQRVETEFVGAPVGIMDQMACSLGRPGEALFIDTQAIAYERIPWPAGAELIVIDSGVAHQHAGGGYGDRRRESFAAAAALGVAYLREVGVDRLPEIARLPAIEAGRARHIVTENQRVLDAVAALRAGDLEAVGRLFALSHASMRDDYAITTPEIDALVALGQADPGIFGARMTGGGFGGAVVMLARAGAGRDAADRIVRAYEASTSCRAAILSPIVIERTVPA
jgi:galactokinase